MNVKDFFAVGCDDGKGDTDQQNRAKNDRERVAIWAFGGGVAGPARTGGAARHAVQSAE
jgi:hypothetical protein